MKMLGDNIKFGGNQLRNPIPNSIAFKVIIVSAVCAFVSIFIQSISDWIPDVWQHVITGFLNGIIGVCNMLLPFFGVKIEGNIPANKVSVVEEKK